MTQSDEPEAGLVLLTGAEGAIGAHIGRALRDDGFRVRGLDLRPAVGIDGDHVVADVLDLDRVREAVAGAVAVVHAGAIPHDRDDGSEVMATNVMGTWNVLLAALEAGVERVICFSSINALGSVGGWRETEYLPVDDAYPPHPMSPYQLSKHLVEEACRSFSERHGLVTICLRPVWVPRPGSPQLEALGTDAFRDGWRHQLWAYVDVRDVCDAVLRSLRADRILHDRFLLSARDTTAVEETRDLVEREYPGVPWPHVDPDSWFAQEPHRSLIDCGRALDVLGWEARHSWRDPRPDLRRGR
jgi:nucleoside-diphosphate-sugar epimerase